MVPEDRAQINELVALAARIQALLEEQGWKFCFIGGLAVQAWSEPRYTKDVDLTLLTGFGNEERFIDVLLSHFTARRGDAREFALRNRVLLLQDEKGIGIDVALGALPFEEEAVRRSTMVGGVSKRFAAVLHTRGSDRDEGVCLARTGLDGCADDDRALRSGSAGLAVLTSNSDHWSS